MGKFYGPVGFAEPVETSPSVWTDRIVEHNYYGDITKDTRKVTSSGGVNDNIVTSNNISIIADIYARDHSDRIRYVEFMGTKWKVDSVTIEYPRLMLILGGVYNE